METGCEPSLLLNDPGRFRHVCPLLRRNAAGQWRCSVNTENVRPFWGRAAFFFFSAAVGLYLSGSLGAWALLRHRGYRLTYVDVAWPPAWSRFHIAQSHLFARRATAALERRDISDAIMSSAVAYRLDPSNYTLGRLLAQLTQVGQPGLADQTYARLLQDHRDRAPETLAAWYESLLWRADFRSIAQLSLEALEQDPARSGVWLHALFFAARRDPDESLLQKLASHPRADVRALGSLEKAARAGGPPARDALLTYSASSSGYEAYYRPRRLIDLGFSEEALPLVSDPSLPPRDQLALRLDALAGLGAPGLRQREFERVLRSQVDPLSVELLSAHLVRNPAPELLAGLFDAVGRQPLPSDERGYRAWAGLMCAAGAAGDFNRFHEATAAMRSISGAEFQAAKQVEAFFREDAASSRIESYLPAMQPLAPDVTYALLERFYRPRPRAAAPPLQ